VEQRAAEARERRQKLEAMRRTVENGITSPGGFFHGSPVVSENTTRSTQGADSVVSSAAVVEGTSDNSCQWLLLVSSDICN